MNAPGRPPLVNPMRVLLLASAATAIVATVIAVQRATANATRVPPEMNVALLSPADAPIAAEAQVFRTNPGTLAIQPVYGARRAAHPRTLATFRNLRAYPGAPPRIPHGLTPSEFQNGNCKTCHERGGYSERFDAYVPVTPHPELGACLSCHVGDAKLMAVSLPSTDPNARCPQCHSPGAGRWKDSTVDWKPMAWPQIPAIVAGRTPPHIPHALLLRENCLACHSAPSGVAELQTRHPQLANCRQCHVEGAS